MKNQRINLSDLEVRDSGDLVGGWHLEEYVIGPFTYKAREPMAEGNANDLRHSGTLG